MPSAQHTNAEAIVEYRRGEFLISTDPGRLDLNMIHGFLTSCYWARGIPRDVVARSIEHSLCFGVYDDAGAQLGFARVISDYATFAYIADVFVLESHRGRGLGKKLLESIKQHRALQGLRRWNLSTKDAHELYAQYGFVPLKWPGEIYGNLPAQHVREGLGNGTHHDYKDSSNVSSALRSGSSDCRGHR